MTRLAHLEIRVYAFPHFDDFAEWELGFSPLALYPCACAGPGTEGD